ncbi:hemolysin family protein [Urbifossiella limnaea]|uniref:Hemolysin C n=1 Tax=Urbifossiella limnaea TaxID=2528023 RepID=A0A517XYY4_9BACT|nr:hemolysin family protein [Urbifossiella limnaea]QDU22683.1 Hemolysin C [Urbifossiella limnaea]
MVLFAADAAGAHWAWSAAGLAAVPALVALNGFFVAAEFALVAVRRTRVEELATQGKPGAAAARDAVAHLDRTIAATQLGITLASIALGWVGEPTLARLVTPAAEALLPAGGAVVAAHAAAVALAFALITFLHVVFGELIPKTLALRSPEGTSLRVAAPLNLFVRLTRPAIALLNGTGNLVLRAIGCGPAGSESNAHSVDELSQLVGETEGAGALTARQAELVRKVFTLAGRRVRDCMVPREKVAALALGTPPERVLDQVRAGAHTRMPVYDGDLDRVVGVVNTKDLFHLFSLRGLVSLEDALYPPQFVGPDDGVADALDLFRRARRPLAVVRDAAGRVLGLITLEDVLEQIVGPIEDEHDRRRWPLPALAVSGGRA